MSQRSSVEMNMKETGQTMMEPTITCPKCKSEIRLLSFICEPRVIDFYERIPQHRCNRANDARMRNPYAIDHVERLDAFRESVRNENGYFCLGCSLIVAQLGQPTIAPILGSF